MKLLYFFDCGELVDIEDVLTTVFKRKIARKNDLEAYILGMRSGDPGTFAVSIFLMPITV